jgi:hypothetical protein
MHFFKTAEAGTIQVTGSVADTVTAFSIGADITHSAGVLMDFRNPTGSVAAVLHNGALRTSPPSGSAGIAFKVGDVINFTGVISTGRCLLIDVGGTTWKIPTFI